MPAGCQHGWWWFPRERGGAEDLPPETLRQLFHMRLKSQAAPNRVKALHQACAIPLWRVASVLNSAPQMR